MLEWSRTAPPRYLRGKEKIEKKQRLIEPLLFIVKKRTNGARIRGETVKSKTLALLEWNLPIIFLTESGINP